MACACAGPVRHAGWPGGSGSARLEHFPEAPVSQQRAPWTADMGCTPICVSKGHGSLLGGMHSVTRDSRGRAGGRLHRRGLGQPLGAPPPGPPRRKASPRRPLLKSPPAWSRRSARGLGECAAFKTPELCRCSLHRQVSATDGRVLLFCPKPSPEKLDSRVGWTRCLRHVTENHDV